MPDEDKPERVFHENTCPLCGYKAMFCDIPPDKIWVCYPCREMRFIEVTFTCPLCQGRKPLTRDYTYLSGRQVCLDCSRVVHSLEEFAAKGNARSQNLLDIARLILRPMYERDKMIPSAIYSATARWGDRWVGPPSNGKDTY